MRLDPGDHPPDLVEHYEAFLKPGHRAMLRMVDAEAVAQAVELGVAQEERRHVAVRTPAVVVDREEEPRSLAFEPLKPALQEALAVELGPAESQGAAEARPRSHFHPSARAHVPVLPHVRSSYNSEDSGQPRRLAVQSRHFRHSPLVSLAGCGSSRSVCASVPSFLNARAPSSLRRISRPVGTQGPRCACMREGGPAAALSLSVRDAELLAEHALRSLAPSEHRAPCRRRQSQEHALLDSAGSV